MQTIIIIICIMRTYKCVVHGTLGQIDRYRVAPVSVNILHTHISDRPKVTECYRKWVTFTAKTSTQHGRLKKIGETKRKNFNRLLRNPVEYDTRKSQTNFQKSQTCGGSVNLEDRVWLAHDRKRSYVTTYALNRL